VKKARKEFDFMMRILRKGNSNTKCLAYTSLVRPILEYGVACWNPYRKGQISALDRVQRNVAKLTHHRNDLQDSVHMYSLQSIHRRMSLQGDR
jgi:hypothetical protein